MTTTNYSAVICFAAVVRPFSIHLITLFLSSSSLLLLVKVAGVSEAYEDAANCLWLLSNSKPCANCKSPIQKNEGCNHMQCAKVSPTVQGVGAATEMMVRLKCF